MLGGLVAGLPLSDNDSACKLFYKRLGFYGGRAEVGALYLAWPEGSF